MSAYLKQIDGATNYLRTAGAVRTNGQWLTPDGVALGSDPTEAARALRHLTIQRAVKQQRESGRGFTR